MKRIILFLILTTGILAQTRESLYSNLPNLILRDVMNDETGTRALRGTPANITYTLGKSVFNGTSSTITYPTQYGVKTVRIRVTLATATQSVITLSATHSITVSSGTISATGFSTPSIYVNGVLTSTVTTAESEIVVTTATGITANLFVLGNVGANYLNGTVNFIELGNIQINVSEISNLYNGVAFKELLTSNTLLNFDSRLGTIKSINTVTNSNVTFVRQGSIFSGKWNGSTSYLSIPTVNLSGNITVSGWFKANTFGQNNLGNILTDTKLIVRVNSTGVLQVSRDGSTFISSAASSIVTNKMYCYFITSTSAGVTNIYLGDAKTPLTLSGTANQNAGTPANGSTILIGNNSTSSPTRTFNGIIPLGRIDGAILTLAQGTNLWSSKVGGIR